MSLFARSTEDWDLYPETPDGLEPEVIPPVDSRTCVRSTTVAPYRYVCSLDHNGKPHCTGTLIGPRTVLTAGHCLDDFPANEMRAVPGRRGSREPFRHARAAAYQPAPGFVSTTATDYGAVILRDPIGNRTGWWTFDHHRWPGDRLGTSVHQGSLSPPVAGLTVSISGYPCDLPARTHLGGRRDRCFSRRVRKGTVQYQDTSATVGVTAGGILEYTNDTYHCMSGSGVWLPRDAARGGRVLVAVHVSGDRPSTPPRANGGVLIQGSILDFVRAHSFSPPGTTPTRRPQVRRGSRGATVRELQYRLNIWILSSAGSRLRKLAVDGIFGSKTQAAARGFQRAMRLAVDGIVGPKTWRRLQLPF